MNVEILCSGMTGRIYAAKTDSKGNVKEKVDVTQQVINAVMQHMDVSKMEYECAAGDLVFKPKTNESTESALQEADGEQIDLLDII